MAAQISVHCFVCKENLENSSGMVMKCNGCSFKGHLTCCYPQGTVPVRLLSPNSEAVTNWRCYDCKCCQLCTRTDDPEDGLLLCDGCDSGEHMGCQQPPVTDIPPAPWYCTRCNNASKTSDTNLSTSRTETVIIPTTQQQTIIEDGSDKQKNDQMPILESESGSVSTKSNSGLESTQINSSNIIKAQLAWTAVMNSEFPPPLREETPVKEQKSATQQSVKKGGKITPIKIKLEKRACDSTWQKCGKRVRKGDHERRVVKKRNIRKSSSGSGSSSNENTAAISDIINSDPIIEGILKEMECERATEARKSESSPDGGDRLSLTEMETPEPNQAREWTITQVAVYFERSGHPEAAKAFKREEVDGSALLLLQRQDIICNFGMKLGPALKVFKTVKQVQDTVRSH